MTRVCVWVELGLFVLLPGTDQSRWLLVLSTGIKCYPHPSSTYPGAAAASSSSSSSYIRTHIPFFIYLHIHRENSACVCYKKEKKKEVSYVFWWRFFMFSCRGCSEKRKNFVGRDGIFIHMMGSFTLWIQPPLLIYRNDRLATRSTCKAYVIFVSVFGCWVSFLGGFFGWLYFIFFFSYRVLRLMSAPDPLEIIIPLYFSVGFFLFLRLVLFCLFSRTVADWFRMQMCVPVFVCVLSCLSVGVANDKGKQHILFSFLDLLG